MKKLGNFVIGLLYTALAATDIHAALRETGLGQVALLFMGVLISSYAAYYIGKALKEEETEAE